MAGADRRGLHDHTPVEFDLQETMQAAPEFSVLIPTYNQAAYLPAALESLRAQTDVDWEAVVVNDGSTDATPEVLDAFRARDPRIRVFHQENGGTGAALNRGLDEARGEWLCWLSSDDLFAPGKLQVHRAAIVDHPGCDFFFSHFRYLDDETGTVSDPPLWQPVPDPEWQVVEMLRAAFVHGNSVCVRAAAWREVGGFDVRLRNGQDYDMWLRLLARHRATFLPDRTCITRLHPQQGTSTFPEAGLFDSARAANAFVDTHSFAEIVPWTDLTDARSAARAAERVLDVATSPGGFYYGLSAHPGLALRLLEWAWSDVPRECARDVRGRIRRRARRVMQEYRGTPFGFLWSVVAAAARLSAAEFRHAAVSPLGSADADLAFFAATGDPRAEPLRRYFARMGRERGLAGGRHTGMQGREIVIVARALGSAAQDGRAPEAVSASAELRGRGALAVVAAQDATGLRYVDGVPVLTAPSTSALRRTIEAVGPVYAVVGAAAQATMGRVRTAQHVLDPAAVRGGTGGISASALVHAIEAPPAGGKPLLHRMGYEIRTTGAKIQRFRRRVEHGARLLLAPPGRR